CDKGRFAYSHLYANDRVRDPLRKLGRRRFEELPWETALDEVERLARAAGDAVLLALSGSETVEQAAALAKLVRQGFGSNAVVLPEAASPALDAFRAPLSAIRDAQIVIVVGDEPVVERAPVVDLWIRAARRAGADVRTVGPAGREQTAPGDYDAALERLADDEAVRSAEHVVVVWSGSSAVGAAALGERLG